MLFVTATFASFFLVVVVAHAAVAHRPALWRATMIAASVVFYGWVEPFLAVLLLGYGVVTHLFGRWMAATAHKSAVSRVAVVSLIGVIAVTRHLARFAEFVVAAVSPAFELSWNPQSAWVPLGISFLTFHAVAYVVDIKRGVCAPAPSISYTLTYLSFFPHLAAGPIVRPKAFFAQLDAGPSKNVDVTLAGTLICLGVVKKLLLADILFSAQGFVGEQPDAYSSGDITMWLYTAVVRIYLEASSYADIAVGLGILLGVKLPANFRRPFRSSSMSELWRRWHITVMAWFRDYVFQPLVQRRRGWRMAAAAMAAMSLSGVWHGVGWGFLVWGVGNGVFLVIEGALTQRRQRQRRLRRAPSTSRLWAGRMYVLTVMALLGPLFGGYSVHQTWELWGAAGFGLPTTATIAAIVVFFATLAAHWSPEAWSQRLLSAVRRAPMGAQVLGVAVVLTVTAGLTSPGVAPFLYSQL